MQKCYLSAAGVDPNCKRPVHALVSVLADGTAEARLAAVQALGYFGARALPAVVPLKKVFLSVQDHRLGEEAAASLAKIAPDRPDLWVMFEKATKDPRPALRVRGLVGLSADPAAARNRIDLFIEAVSDGDQSVRVAALKGLRTTGRDWGDTDKRTATVRAVLSKSARADLPTRFWASLILLERLRSDQSIGEVLKDVLNAQDVGFRTECTVAIAKHVLRTRSSRDICVVGIDFLLDSTGGRNAQVRREAIGCLIGLSPGTVPPWATKRITERLISLLEDPQAEIRRASVGCLRIVAYEDVSSHVQIRKLLQDSDPMVRIEAATTIWSRAPLEKELVRLVGREAVLNKDAEVRQFAVMKLASMAEEDSYALRCLEQASRDPDNNVREMAMRFLKFKKQENR